MNLAMHIYIARLSIGGSTALTSESIDVFRHQARLAIQAAKVFEEEAQTHPSVLNALIDAVEVSGYSLSGPTDPRVAEHGEPAWVCRARAAIAAATA